MTWGKPQAPRKSSKWARAWQAARRIQECMEWEGTRVVHRRDTRGVPEIELNEQGGAKLLIPLPWLSHSTMGSEHAIGVLLGAENAERAAYYMTGAGVTPLAPEEIVVSVLLKQRAAVAQFVGTERFAKWEKGLRGV